jgi:hypothetical protein
VRSRGDESRTQETLDRERLWSGYGYPNDLLSWLRVCGLRVRDVPVRPVYGSEQSGIRLRHVILVIPFVIARVWLRSYTWRGLQAPIEATTPAFELAEEMGREEI